MAFPVDQRDLEVSLYINGAWVDATGVGDGVRSRNAVTIDRGQSHWASTPDPAKAQWTMGNSDGRWSPDNPDGAYTGVFKRNLPVRVGVGQGDVYLRYNGASDEAEVCSTPDAADLDVSGDLDFRIEFELEEDLVDIDDGPARSRARLAHKLAGVTGWELQLYSALGEVVAALGWFDSSGFHTITTEASGTALPASFMWQRSALRVVLDVSTGGVSWYTSDSIGGSWTQLGTEDTTAGATSIEASTAPLRIGGNPGDVDHRPFPGKIYAAELRDGSTVVANPDFTAQVPGTPSFSFDDGEGNTWTLGAAGELSDKRWRFHGELSSIPTRWNIDGSNVWAPVEAQGLFRRLRQGETDLDSPLRRAVERSAASVIDYWPMEETGDNVTHFGNMIGDSQMVAVNALQTGQETGFVASKGLPTMNTTTVSSATEQPASTGQIQLRWLQSVPTAFTGTDLEVVAVGTTDGWIYRVQYRDTSDGQFRVLVYDSTTLEYTSAWSDFDANGSLWRMTLGIAQNGADIDITLQGQEQDGSSGGNVFTSVVTHTVGVPLNVVFNNNAGNGIEGWGIGHVTLQNAVTPTSELATELSAHDGETAGARIQRLCLEEGIASRFIGDPGDTAAMGPQSPAALTTLLEECAATDLGTLTESRDSVAVLYRTRKTIEQQAAVATLNYSLGEIDGSPELDRDDQGFRQRRHRQERIRHRSPRRPQRRVEPVDQPATVRSRTVRHHVRRQRRRRLPHPDLRRGRCSPCRRSTNRESTVSAWDSTNRRSWPNPPCRTPCWLSRSATGST